MDTSCSFSTTPFRKTAIILDRRPSFSSHSKICIDLDGGVKSKGSSKSTAQSCPVYKSIWTCMVEASIEYSRVVYDLFPCQNLVRLIVSDAKTHFVNSWSDKDQCVSQVLKPLAALRSQNFLEEEFPMTPALKETLLSFVDSANQKKRISGESDSKGRIICLTSMQSESDISYIVDYVCKTFKGISESGRSSSSQSLHFLDLVLIHVPVSGESGKFSERTFKPMSNVSVSFQTMKATQLVLKMTSLVQKHFNLKSTIVTGIPMKEEQHSGGAMNYDVELLHSSDVHYELDMFNIYCTDISGPCELSQRDEILQDTVTLKWCTTPKASNNMDFHHCIGTFRFTVAEINSRPAACLVSFLLQGRNVLLEQPKKSGNKIISHFLTSHGGDLYIHCLGNSRCPLEDPPSISEGCGGRVTDYRINDFGEFMKSNRLAPLTGPKPKGINPLEKATLFVDYARRRIAGMRGAASSRLERCTRMWPMVISDTLLFNLMSHLEPLTSLIFKEHLTEEDVGECTKVINRLQAMESRNDPLPVGSVGFRGKGPKRDEQYRQLWAEMETFLQNTSTTSKMHAKVFNYLRGDLENDEENSNGFTPIQTDNDELSRTNQAWKDLDNYRNMTERERSDFLGGDKNNDHFYKRSHTNSSAETVPAKKVKFENASSSGSFPQLNYKTAGSKTSLLSMWCGRMDAIAASRHEEFEGRSSSSGNQAELYVEMNGDSNSNSSRSTPVGSEWN